MNAGLFAYQTGDFAVDEICQSMAASQQKTLTAAPPATFPPQL